jgi:hypothetical protein
MSMPWQVAEDGQQFRVAPVRSDHFDGDIYAEEVPVERGLCLASIDVDEDKHTKSTPDGSTARVIFPNSADAVELPVENLPSGQRSIVGDAATPFVGALLRFLGSIDSIVQVPSAAGNVEASLCVGYSLLQIHVRFIAPKVCPTSVAAVWTRLSGDSVDFLSTMRACSEYIQASGLKALEVPAGWTGTLPFQGPLLPHFGAKAGFPEVTPPVTPSGSHLVSLLDVEPCAEEDCEDLIALAESPEERLRAEAAVAMAKMFEGVDAEVFRSVLAKRPKVVMALLRDHACVLAAPALAAKLANVGAVDAGSVVSVLVERLQDEQTPLGVKQLARALAQCANDLRPPPAEAAKFVETISAYSTNDEATRRFLRESVHALQGC